MFQIAAPIAWLQVWQVTIVAASVVLVASPFALRRPHLAHLLWIVVLLKCVTPPLFSSPSGLFCWFQKPATANELPKRDPQVDIPPNKYSPYDPMASTEPSLTLPKPSEPISSRVVTASMSTIESDSGDRLANSRDPSFSMALLLGFGWIAGVALIGLVASVRAISCMRELRLAGSVHDESVEQLVGDLARRLGLKRRVRLLITKGSLGPAVVGIFRPTLIIPEIVVVGKSAGELEPILAHELMHLRRGDLWVGLLQVVAQAFWWFHPLVWGINRLVTRDAERCCDEAVIGELGCDPAVYAHSLVDVLELKQKLKAVPVFPGVRPVEVTSKRLERIMNLRQGSLKRTPLWCWFVMLVATALTLPGAAFIANAHEPPELTTAEAFDGPKANDSRIIKQAYHVGDLLSEIKTSLRVDDEQAKSLLVCQISALSGVEWVDVNAIESTFMFKHNDEPLEGDFYHTDRVEDSILRWSGTKLVAYQTKAIHTDFANVLTALRKDGFAQIGIEAHIIVGATEIIDSLSSNWTTNAPVRSETTVVAADAPRLDRALPHSLSEAHCSARVSVEKVTPVMLEVITNASRNEILQQLETAADVNVVSTTIALYSGQSAIVGDTRDRQFVVGLYNGELQRRVVRCGAMLHLRPILRHDNQIWLDYELTLKHVLRVDETEIEFDGKSTKLQAPEVATTQVNSAVEFPLGATLLSGGVKTIKTDEQPQSVAVLLRAMPVSQELSTQNQHRGALTILGPKVCAGRYSDQYPLEQILPNSRADKVRPLANEWASDKTTSTDPGHAVHPKVVHSLVPFFLSDRHGVHSTPEAGADDSANEEKTESVQRDSRTDRTKSNARKNRALPVFSFTAVSTNVSVPDGGTLLLGGLKRLQQRQKGDARVNLTVSTTVAVSDGGTVLLGGIKRLLDRTKAVDETQ